MKRKEIGKRRILVVDDQPEVRAAIKMLLEYDGHEVETAGSGREALAMIQDEKFDLILTDYSMPVMTGGELAAEIKARLPRQPVGMITAYASMLRAFSEPVTGTDFLVNKPFEMEELRAAMARALSEENT